MRIYFYYFLQFLKTKLIYRWNFFAAILSNLFVAVTGLLFVIFLMDGKQVQDLQGWSREEVLFIFGMATVSTALFSTVSVNLYSFGDRYILRAQFDRVLLRPLNSLSQVLFESFNLDSIGTLIAGLATLVYASNKLQLAFSVLDVLWLIIACFSGAVILLSVFVILASASFHFEDRFGIAPPFYNLMAFGRYPLPIFNRLIQFILTAIVPFAFVGFYPATHFFEREGFALFCYATPLIAFLSTFVAWKFWQFGVSRYESAGG